MRLILQRVKKGGVIIDDAEHRQIGPGLVALVGFGPMDNEKVARAMIDKMVQLRIFDDDAGNLNRSLLDTAGDLLIVPNFTLYANSRKGRRPSFTDAAPPAEAKLLYDAFVAMAKTIIQGICTTGEFGAMMEVEIINDGPITIILDSDQLGITSEK